ncbi:MAG: hypothetical protein QOJ15_10312 [Bradyrhizobium sp.]|nr:hypothetical protein [Bradyrhizobium sp.]
MERGGHKYAARLDVASAGPAAELLLDISGSRQLTPSFFCRLDDEVVY